MDHNSYKTSYINKSTAEKKWVLVDAKDKPLGRLSSRVAYLLLGKNKPGYTPHVDMGDHVIVINAEHVHLTGKKWDNRVIFTHSGYPGSQRRHIPRTIKAKNPIKLIEHSVRGMLPKRTRLGRQLFRSLHVYPTDKHPHEAQQPNILSL